MDIDAYSLGLLVETRLAEARAQSARYALLRSVGAGRADMLTAFGLGLISGAMARSPAGAGPAPDKARHPAGALTPRARASIRPPAR